MKTVLLLLSISPFFLGKANSDSSEKIKYAQWHPQFLSNEDDSNVITYTRRGSSKCIVCHEIFSVGRYKNRPSYPRHRRPGKQKPRIPDRQVFEISDVQANRIPNRPSPWMPHKLNSPYPISMIPERLSTGLAPITSVHCVEKPKTYLKTGWRNWSHFIGSVPKKLGSCECGKSDSLHMIIQGIKVEPPFKYPWMVALQKKDGLTFCGGGIVSDQYILTAAHCLANRTYGFHSPNEIQVAFVTNTDLVSEGVDVTDVIPHPQFEYVKADHDIGLLKLKEKIQCSEERRPICLPTHGMQANVGQQFVIAGWGSRVGGTSDTSPFLMETLIKMVDFGKCSRSFSALKENFYCLQGVNNSSPCHGDSGGPMFLEHQNKFYVYGVASMHSSKFCETSETVVYTKIINYLDWIKKKMRH